MKHELKTLPNFFEMVLDGIKTYEIRKLDRPFAVGDELHLKEWSPESGYSGRVILRKVLSIVRHEDFPDGIKPGYGVIAMK